jgi:hypothetical protein
MSPDEERAGVQDEHLKAACLPETENPVGTIAAEHTCTDDDGIKLAGAAGCRAMKC